MSNEVYIPQLPTTNYWVNYKFSNIENFINQVDKEIGIELCPDFQRGHVWDYEQQVEYIQAILTGVVADSDIVIRFNARDYTQIRETTDTDLPKTMQCIDGLQRLTAIREYMKGNIKPFGYTFEEIESSKYAIGKYRTIVVQIYELTKRKDLLKFYYDLNWGGTPHSEHEKERILGLIYND